MMTKKYFRFRSMGYAADGGKVDHKIEIFAPTVGMLKERLAMELIASRSVPSFSYVDRVKVDLSDKGVLTFKEILIKKALDANLFVGQVLCSKIYKELRAREE